MTSTLCPDCLTRDRVCVVVTARERCTSGHDRMSTWVATLSMRELDVLRDLLVERTGGAR